MENSQNIIKKKIREISKILTCNICKKILKNPLLCNQCLFFYCFECLKNKSNGKCPYCENEFESDNFKSIDTIKKLSIILNEIESLIKENKEKGMCVSHPKNFNKYYCLNCKKKYCDECFVFFGKEKDNHFNHDIFTLEELKKYNLKCCIKEYEKIEKSLNEYFNFVNHFNIRIKELEFESQIKSKEINRNYKNEIESKCEIQINNLETAKNELENLSNHFDSLLSSIPNAISNIISRRDYNGSDELYNKLLKEKEKIDNIENEINSPIPNIQFYSYEFPSIHIEQIGKKNDEELYRDSFLYNVPDCIVIITIKNSDDNKNVVFIIDLSSNDDKFLFYEFKVYLGIYNYNEKSFRKLRMENNIKNEKDLTFKGTLTKVDFFNSCQEETGDMYLKFYIFKYEIE